jgi:hypothetical protein
LVVVVLQVVSYGAGRLEGSNRITPLYVFWQPL